MQLYLPGPVDELARLRISGRPGLVQMGAHFVHRFADVLDSLPGDVLALLGHDDAADVARDRLVKL